MTALVFPTEMRFKHLAFFISAFVCFVANANIYNAKDQITMFGHKEEIDSTQIYDILLHNAPEDFQNPGVPSVAVVGKHGKFIIGVGGYVKTVVGWDFGHPIESADEFITSEIPMQPAEGDGSRFNLSAKQTHLFLNFVALPGTGNEIGAFISANLLDNYRPTLQFAYLKYRGLQAGYDYTLFSDPACGVPAVDYEGPCSYTAIPVAGISYLWEPKPHGRWELALGIELPQTSYTTVEDRSKEVYQRFPDIPIAAKYAWANGNSWVRVSSILRTLTYRDLLGSTNHNRFAYGFQLSGAVNFLDKLTFFYQGVWGKGIASVIQDGVDQGLDMVPAGNGSTLDPVMVWGGFCSLLYDISSRFSASATYSQFRTYASSYADGSTPWSEQYKYGQYASANVFFKATSFFDVGLEYIWGRRANYDGLKCADNRVLVALQLSF